MINYTKTTRKNLAAPNGPQKTYAVAQVREVITLSQFAEMMSRRNSKYGKGDFMAVLTELVDHVKEQLLAGNKVHLGDLGSFWLTLKSRGVFESVVDEQTGEKPVFTANNITGINVQWKKSLAFKSPLMLREASFCEVATRREAAEALKAKQEALEAGTYQPGDNKQEEKPSTSGEGNVETHE